MNFKTGLNSKLIPVKLVIYKDKIIKVLEENDSEYCGYDIISEKMYLIKRNNNAIDLPEVVVRLLGCEGSRLKLANAICNGSQPEIAKKF